MDTTLSAGPRAVKIPAVPVCLTSFRTVVRMPYWKDRKWDSGTEWRIYYAEWRLTVFLTTGIDSSLALWMTLNVPFIMTLFPSSVILNGVEKALRERRETEQWHGVKNLWLWWRLTVFLTTVIDSSHLLRMTINAPLTTTANPLLIFRMTPNGNHLLRLLTHS